MPREYGRTTKCSGGTKIRVEEISHTTEAGLRPSTKKPAIKISGKALITTKTQLEKVIANLRTAGEVVFD